MENYFGLLRRHGLKLWVSFFVGSLAAGVIAGIAAVIIILIGGITLFFTGGDSLGAVMEFFDTDPSYALEKLFSPGMIIPAIIIAVLLVGLFLLCSGFTAAGTNAMMRDVVFEDRTSIERYFTQGFRHMWKMTGQLLLISLFHIPVFALFAAGVLSTLPGIIEGETPSFAGILLFLLIGMALILLLTLIFLHAPVILISENAGIWNSIVLSARLFARSFAQVFLSGLIVFLIYALFTVGLFILGVIIGVVTFDPSAAHPAGTNAGVELFFNLIQYVLTPLVQVFTLLAVFLRYRNLLRPRLFPEHGSNGAEDGAKIFEG